MKSITRFLSAFFLLLTFFSINVYSQDYAMTVPLGYGAGATGGSGTPITVKNYSELKAALGSSGKVILVSGEIIFPENADPISVKNNTTLIGLPAEDGRSAAKLKVYSVPQGSRKQDGSGSGLLSIGSSVSNVVIRNLIFQGPGPWDTNEGKDLISNQGQNIWVDHCEFYDGMDGSFDNNNKADNITISWCKFGYSIAPKSPVGKGTSDNHSFSCLVGGNDGDAPADGQYSITFAYCYWAEGVAQRMPRGRNAQLHILNCYYNTSKGSEAIGMSDGTKGGTDCYVENSHFEKVGSSSTPSESNIFKNKGGAPNITFVGCIRGANTALNKTLNGAAVAKPGYVSTYTALPVANVKSVVNGSCGAGATLQVTEAGEVSSACATGSVPLVTPSGIVATPSTTSINLSWNAVTGADSYIVELCSGGNAGSAGLSDFTASSGTFVANSDGSVTKAAGSGLVLQSPAVGDLKGATISIDLKFTSTATKRLYVKLNNNESNNSNNKIGEAYDNTTSDRQTLTFTVPANSTYSTGNDYIALRFESAVAATIYSISVTPAGGGGGNTPEDCDYYPSENNSITIPGLNPNTSYRYRVKAIKGTESSAYSTVATTKTLSTGTAINEWTTDNSYTVFQQGNDLVVRGGEVKSLEVYSISGACIARAENTESINLAQLSSGALIVRINEKTVKKIIWKQ